jgi:hypothetical protein
MRRRTFLGVLGASALAGCTSNTSGVESTRTNTGTRTATTTATDDGTTVQAETATETEAETTAESADRPTVEAANLLTHWNGAGDTLDNAMDAVGKGGTVKLGVRAVIPGDPADVTIHVSYERDGESIERLRLDGGETVTTDDTDVRETMGYLRSPDWKRGEYVASVTATNDRTGASSEPVETAFEVTDPLPADGVDLKQAVVPSSVEKGEPFDYTLVFENGHDRDGTFVSPMSFSTPGTARWVDMDAPMRVNMRADETRHYTVEGVKIPNSGTKQYRIDALDEQFSFVVTSDGGGG